MNDAMRRGGGLQMTFRANLRPSPGEKPVNCRVKLQCLQPRSADGFGVSRSVLLNDSRFECGRQCCSFRDLHFTSSLSW